MHVSDFRVQGRATQGVKVINLEKRNDTIASVCCVDSEPEIENMESEMENTTDSNPEYEGNDASDNNNNE